jgi:hypothetical protein
MLTRHSLKSTEIDAEQPIAAYLVLLAEHNEIPRIDALVHELGIIGRWDVSFVGERPDAPLLGSVGMRAVPLEAVEGPSPRKVGQGSLCFFADLIVPVAPAHDSTAVSLSRSR